ncbi:hypothetical protein K432DRAFT_423847 [Lepidopterella palustris CBS 459.81]|uniref:NACHT domain-containing protein n=1 Tax=Lepidopterella palustris CBS 459.81 TaxID=1314670 RepID=A0A8E2EF22_9PEZI|nr:hypothetical protein K432DRAFT_423847 [Lepidopterella palustris CBS 459.81]
MVVDPISALGVASAVVTFVDFTSKLISRSRPDGSKIAAKPDLALITKDLKDISDKLHDSLSQDSSDRDNDKGLRQICFECSNDASLLSNALDRLRTNSKHRKWSSFRLALESIWAEKEIGELKERLDGFRQQLIIHILVSLRQKASDTIQPGASTAQRSKDDSTNEYLIGEKFLQDIEEKGRWREDIIEAIYEEDLQTRQHDFPLAVYPANGFAGSQIPISRFLGSLRFEHMTSRHAHVAEAYHHTFQWLYHRPGNETSPWDSFVEWLENGGPTNIYHICGKPASGKSTLMKYICNQPLTQQHLDTWASGVPLIRASFFFWNSGTKMQTSREGLLRTLLYQCLSQCPEAIPQLCPKRWDAYRLFGQDPHPWGLSELLETVALFIQEYRDTRKICFFIDGLDEFEGDHTELLGSLLSLVQGSSVKICVSSRPWPVFIDAFHGSPSLMLQSLTTQDIKYFAEQKLFRTRGYTDLRKLEPEYAARLVEEISAKSSGVFLWVHFVVELLFHDLKDGRKISDLQDKLEKLPPGLEKLFKDMIDRFEPHHCERASELFQLVRAARTPISLLSLSFADDEDYETTMMFPIRPLTKDEKLARCTWMKRRLDSLCKGLLEVENVMVEGEIVANSPVPSLIDLSDAAGDPPDSHGIQTDQLSDAAVDVLSKSTVQYMHRTVKDYLHRPEVWNRLLSVTREPSDTRESFNPYTSLCQCSLLQLKVIDPPSITRNSFWNVIIRCLIYAAESESRSTIPLTDLLDELDRVAAQIATMPSLHGPSLLAQHIGTPPKIKRVPQRTQRRTPHWSAMQTRSIRDSSFLCLAVQAGLYHYVAEKLAENGPPERSSERRSLLDCALLDYHILTDIAEWPSPEPVRSVELVELLLDKGVDPNRIDGFASTPWRNLLARIRTEYKGEPENTVQWQGRKSRIRPNPDEKKVQARRPRIPECRKKFWMDVVELFILHGANSWVDLDRATGGALRAYDSERARELKAMLRKNRRSWLQVKKMWARQ